MKKFINEIRRELMNVFSAEYTRFIQKRREYPRDVLLPWEANLQKLDHELTPGQVAAVIDHTLIKAEATQSQIAVVCQEAIEYGFASVAINPCHVAFAVDKLGDSGSVVGTAIGFPLGTTTKDVKVFEAKQAVDSGAKAIDMVLSIGALKSGDFHHVYDEIYEVVEATDDKVIVKVILETSLLTNKEKVQACFLSKIAGADFVKTSTGMGTSGATVEDVRLMRETIGESMGIKASGGVRDYNAVFAMLRAGATRIGSSSGVSIVRSIPV